MNASSSSTVEQSLPEKNMNRRMDLMNTSLDNFTLALFATLRGGGEMINQEDEYINIIRTCPLCKSFLEILYLGNFEEDGQTFERLLWRCPRQPTQTCYFPMNILPLEVFWTRRTMEQMQHGIKPLPNLHLLPVHRHHYYPKLFQPNSKGERIDLKALIEISSFVPSLKNSRQPGASANINRKRQIEPGLEQSIPVHYTTTKSCALQLPKEPIVRVRSSETNSRKSNSSETSVRDFLKARLRETRKSKKGQEEESQGMSRCGPRKTVDISSNTAAALNSHLILNGTDSDGGKILDLPRPKDLVNPLPQGQMLRLRSQMRSTLNKINDGEASSSKQAQEVEEEEQDQPIAKRTRRSSGTGQRYTSYVPKALMKSAPKKKTLDDKPEKPKRAKKLSREKVTNALQQIDLKRRQKSLPFRFGIGRSMMPIPASLSEHEHETHYELHEGCLPEEESPQIAEDNIINEVDGCQTTAATTSSSSCKFDNVHKITRRIGPMDKVGNCQKKTPSGPDPIEQQFEELIRRKQEELLLKAIKQRQTKSINKPVAPVPSTSTANMQSAIPSGSPTELFGIPHDFDDQQNIATTAHTPIRMSEFAPISYGSVAEDETDNIYANYERFANVTEIRQSTLVAMDEDDEFDFGFGLESEFQMDMMSN